MFLDTSSIHTTRAGFLPLFVRHILGVKLLILVAIINDDERLAWRTHRCAFDKQRRKQEGFKSIAAHTAEVQQMSAQPAVLHGFGKGFHTHTHNLLSLLVVQVYFEAVGGRKRKERDVKKNKH
jgi:hypothetical protein